jgi:tetratricopeptide (TPR) repeat protein
VVFNEAIERFSYEKYEESFGCFERAARKGHEGAIWISSVVNGVKMEEKALKEAFANTETPLGWYLSGRLSYSKERFEFYKKSAEGGCGWGMARYGQYFKDGEGGFVEKDENAYFEWLENVATRNNPDALYWLGVWFQDKEEYTKALSYYLGAAELGCASSMQWLGMLRNREGCARDLTQAVGWYARGDQEEFFYLLNDARLAFDDGMTEDLDFDFNQLCYSLACGLYWYMHGTKKWYGMRSMVKVFGNRCLEYYCKCVELQQKSIFTFLMCWRKIIGVNDVGVMIGKILWRERTVEIVFDGVYL